MSSKVSYIRPELEPINHHEWCIRQAIRDKDPYYLPDFSPETLERYHREVES